jgi:hypothetical protein
MKAVVLLALLFWGWGQEAKEKESAPVTILDVRGNDSVGYRGARQAELQFYLENKDAAREVVKIDLEVERVSDGVVLDTYFVYLKTSIKAGKRKWESKQLPGLEYWPQGILKGRVIRLTYKDGSTWEAKP